MHSIKLFDDIERTHLEPSANNELPYNYYNRSARKDMTIVRNKLEEWFVNIPLNDKQPMKASFKKKFYDTFYELFLFNLFKSLGFNIEIHPKISDSMKRPDFLISKGDLEIYVEAKISKDMTQEEEAFERMKNNFYDSINKMRIENFMLGIEELSFISKKQPKAKKIILKLKKELKILNSLEVEKNTGSSFRDHKIKYEDEDVFVIFNPIPINASSDYKFDKRPIGIYPFEFLNSGGEEAIRNSINLKSKRYGLLGKPYLICINALGKGITSRIDVDNAVWGSVALSYSENPNNHDEKWIRMPDGIFLDEKGPRKRNLSAVFISQIYPHGIPNSPYWLYSNPFADYEIDYEKLGLKHNFVETGKIKSIEGNDLSQILNIDRDWLSK